MLLKFICGNPTNTYWKWLAINLSLVYKTALDIKDCLHLFINTFFKMLSYHFSRHIFCVRFCVYSVIIVLATSRVCRFREFQDRQVTITDLTQVAVDHASNNVDLSSARHTLLSSYVHTRPLSVYRCHFPRRTGTLNFNPFSEAHLTHVPLSWACPLS